MKRPFVNDAPQSERRATIQNDQRVARDVSTYVDHVHEDSGGRYWKQTPSMTVGSRPLVEYPALPSNSPWHHDPVPPEEPLGVDLSAAPIVGEPHEIAASLGEANSGDVGHLLPKVVDSASPGGERSAGRVPPASSAPSPSLKRKRRRHA
jgi:hypothetical protein